MLILLVKYYNNDVNSYGYHQYSLIWCQWIFFHQNVLIFKRISVEFRLILIISHWKNVNSFLIINMKLPITHFILWFIQLYETFIGKCFASFDSTIFNPNWLCFHVFLFHHIFGNAHRNILELVLVCCIICVPIYFLIFWKHISFYFMKLIIFQKIQIF